MHDLVIRGGTVVDGTGSAPREGDVAIDAGKVAAVGRVAARGREEIDARGKLVTPGFVDVHTHYDGQATWDPLLTPSCWHGVTTLVMGNCGVGFAPVRPGKQDFLIGLMEGVEDIPGTALHEGITWSWETFPQFLDALDAGRYALDLGTQVPHGAVRAYVMGDRGAKNEPATPEDVTQMAAIVKEGIEAGALGFSMSRTLVHRAIDGEVVPGTHASEDEIFGICRPLGELGRGLVELAPAGVMGEDLVGAREGGRVDAPPLDGDRPARLVRALAARGGQGPVEEDPRAVPRGERGRLAPAPAGRLAPDDAADRPLHLPPVLAAADLQEARRAAAARARGEAARPGDPPEDPRRVAAAGDRSAPRRRHHADRERAAQDLPARRSAGLRARAGEEHPGDRSERRA